MMIATQDLTFAYRAGGEVVIDRLNHRFEPGSVTVVTGASGSGKSTLLYLLGLMVTPSAGSVSWADVTVSALADGRRAWLRASKVGFVFQDAMLDPARTVMENVIEGALFAGHRKRDANRRASELLETFGVTARSTHRPGEISGGQAQRVALCRALVKDPEVVLADEPTGNLDQASAEVVWTALARIAAGGATVIVATHDQRRAAEAKDVLTL